MNIFVSYTTRDSEISLHRLNEVSIKLKQIGYVYVDIIDNNSQDKQKRVFYELDNSDVIVLIASNSVYNSKWVALEIERARKKKIPIIPFTIDEISTLRTDIIYKRIYSILNCNYEQINAVIPI